MITGYMKKSTVHGTINLYIYGIKLNTQIFPKLYKNVMITYFTSKQSNTYTKHNN